MTAGTIVVSKGAVCCGFMVVLLVYGFGVVLKTGSAFWCLLVPAKEAEVGRSWPKFAEAMSERKRQ